jgi:hypothetical protein
VLEALLGIGVWAQRLIGLVMLPCMAILRAVAAVTKHREPVCRPIIEREHPLVLQGRYCGCRVGLAVGLRSWAARESRQFAGKP